MVGGKWIKACLYIGEILPKQRGHVRIKASAVWYRRIGMALSNSSTIPSASVFRKSTHDQAVANIPSDARQLGCAVGDAGTDAGKWTAHGPFPATTLAPPAILANPKLFANRPDRAVFDAFA
jgi:hypothetical protein